MKIPNRKPRPPQVLTVGRIGKALEADKREKAAAAWRARHTSVLDPGHPLVGSLREAFAGRYALGPVLGQGGTGIVFRSVEEATGRLVAVKVWRETRDGDARRAKGEHDTLAMLDHPGVIKPIAHGAIDGRAFLVSELVEGVTLTECIALPGPRIDLVPCLIAAARALEHCHQRGVAGANVSPWNTMITASGSKLVDFCDAVHLVDDAERFAQFARADVRGAGRMLGRAITGNEWIGALPDGPLGATVALMISEAPLSMTDAVALMTDATAGAPRP